MIRKQQKTVLCVEQHNNLFLDGSHLHTASLAGQAHDAVDSKHARSILIRRNGGIAGQAKALRFSFQEKGGDFESARAARSSNLAQKSLSSANDARHQFSVGLAAKLFSDAKAFRNTGAAKEFGKVSGKKGVAAAASCKHVHISGINVSHFDLLGCDKYFMVDPHQRLNSTD